jgi:AraC family transcriptional regulator, transcriptional activator of pobA
MRWLDGKVAGGPPAVGRVPVARLRQEGSSVEVETSAGDSFGTAGQGPHEPHRHDYHEICWTRGGSGLHLIDGQPFPVVPGTLTLIGRGQIHVFERGSCIVGAAVRFGDELLADRSVTRTSPRWLLDPHGRRTVHVPPSHVRHLEGIHEALAAETSRPLDSRSIDVQRYLIATLLLWVDRWYEATSTEQRCTDDADAQLCARFLSLLDRDFACHHDTGHYATALAASPAHLSRVLARTCGRTSKELITDRVMVEAARLLRFTDLAVGEVAFGVGFDDRFYFSRAFKRRYGESPLAYRARLRGLSLQSQPPHEVPVPRNVR